MVWETYQRIAREIALTAYFSAAVCAGASQIALMAEEKGDYYEAVR